MSSMFPKLKVNQQRGSKPRCHLLTEGTASDVAARLTSLIAPWGSVRASDSWLPAGFERCREAQLHSASELLPDAGKRDALRDWWLAVSNGRTTTPNIDVASTCLVQGQEGVLLVEAKAHDYELSVEERGKPLKDGSSEDTLRNHKQIGDAIEAANASLTNETKLLWSLSRDSRYQMSNRFAWSWKLTELGVPVILVYLGFTGCVEMREGKTKHPIPGLDEWKAMVCSHSKSLFPSEVWGRAWPIHGQSFVPLIKTVEQQLRSPR
jgi:hypothetical protein